MKINSVLLLFSFLFSIAVSASAQEFGNIDNDTGGGNSGTQQRNVPGNDNRPGFPNMRGMPGGGNFAIFGIRMQAIAAARDDSGQLDTAKFQSEFMSKLKEFDTDNNGILSTEEMEKYQRSQRPETGGPGQNMPGGGQGPGFPGEAPRNMAGNIFLMGLQMQALMDARAADGKVEIARFKEAFLKAAREADANSDNFIDEEEIQQSQAKRMEEMRRQMERANGNRPNRDRAGSDRNANRRNSNDRPSRNDNQGRQMPPGGFGQRGPGMGPGMGPGAQAGISKIIADATSENGDMDIHKIESDLADLLKTADANNDALLDETEQQTVFGGRMGRFGGPGGEPMGPGNGNNRSRNNRNQNRTQDRPGRPEMDGPQGGPNRFPQMGARPDFVTEDGKIDLSKLDSNMPKQMISAFKEADTNGDGFVDPEESRTMMANRPMGRSGMGGPQGEPGQPGMGFPGMGGPQMAPGLLQTVMSEVFTEDGKIDLSKLEPTLANTLQEADTDQDGFLDETEQQKAFGMMGRMGNDPGNRGPRNNSNMIQVTGIETPGPEYVPIPANTSFKFKNARKNQNNAEEASIEHDYCMGRFPVTNADYMEFVKATDRKTFPMYWQDGTFAPDRNRHPVVGVTLQDAKDYCDWLTSQTEGWTFRLPTEAEYENAASGPKKLRYPWGNSDDITYRDGQLNTNFNYNGLVASDYLEQDETIESNGKDLKLSKIVSISNKGVVKGWRNETEKTGFTYTSAFKDIVKQGGYTTPVGMFRDNMSPYGCFDMAGNVSEWTSDVDTSVKGKKNQVVRGGSWFSSAAECSGLYRDELKDATKGDPTTGFRVVAEKNN